MGGPSNGFFMRMCKEAEGELAGGLGWKEAPTNTLILAAFGMLANHLASRIVRPMWFFASAVSVAVVGWLFSLFLG